MGSCGALTTRCPPEANDDDTKPEPRRYPCRFSGPSRCTPPLQQPRPAQAGGPILIRPARATVPPMSDSTQPRDSEGLRTLARSHIGEGRWQDALAVLTDLCNTDVADAQDWFLLGALHGRLGDFEAAIHCCRKSLALRPGDPDTHYNLAQACLHNGDPAAAAASYREVLRRRPDHFDALNNLGYALQRLGQYAEAAAYHEHALVVQPQHPDALINLGIARHGLGKPDAAVEAYQTALRVAPGSARAWYNLGFALHARERYADEATAYRRALDLQPDNMAAYTNLGTLLLAEGRHAETDAACAPHWR